MSTKSSQNIVTASIRWLARIGSLVSIAILLMFLFGGNEKLPNLMETIGLVFFPFGIMVGMAIGWKNELFGGVVTVLSLAAFYAGHFLTAGNLPSGPYFILFALPGILFLFVGSATRILGLNPAKPPESTSTRNSNSVAG